MWTFAVSAGKMYNSDDEFAGEVYAGGDCGARPDAVNNPTLENLKDTGPLPCGTYTADKLYPVHPTLGKFAVHLQPDEETQAKIISYGRDPDSFYFHGDEISKEGQRAASDGCIVGALEVRVLFWSGMTVIPDHVMQVIPGVTQ